MTKYVFVRFYFASHDEECAHIQKALYVCYKSCIRKLYHKELFQSDAFWLYLQTIVWRYGWHKLHCFWLFDKQKTQIFTFQNSCCWPGDSEITSVLKRKACEEWLLLILRTREVMTGIKEQIEANNVHICELHFKPECILTSTFFQIYWYCWL